MYDRILVPLDGTTFSEQALDFAVALARRSQAALHLAVVDLERAVDFPEVAILPPISEVESGYLETMAERARAVGVEDVSVSVLTGGIAEALEQYRISVGAELTVMTTHGRGPIQRAWLGSIADRFSRITGAAVILLRPRVIEDSEGPMVPVYSLDRVMVTVDGSQLSESAVGPAVAVGRNFDAEYLITRMIPYPHFPSSVYLPDVVGDNAKFVATAQENAEAEVEVVRARLEEEGAVARSVVRVVTHAAQGIIDLADEEDVGLIVMAVHGHGRLERLLLGSTTDKVLRGGDVPVMLIPRPLKR